MRVNKSHFYEGIVILKLHFYEGKTYLTAYSAQCHIELENCHKITLCQLQLFPYNA